MQTTYNLLDVQQLSSVDVLAFSTWLLLRCLELATRRLLRTSKCPQLCCSCCPSRSSTMNPAALPPWRKNFLRSDARPASLFPEGASGTRCDSSNRHAQRSDARDYTWAPGPPPLPQGRRTNSPRAAEAGFHSFPARFFDSISSSSCFGAQRSGFYEAQCAGQGMRFCEQRIHGPVTDRPDMAPAHLAVSAPREKEKNLLTGGCGL
jgi:hypothetical protein